jgi:predicted Ser/Thr protein kinase
MQKYEDWSKVLIEPQTLNDARLFALETRIHEEENLRMKEFHVIKDYYMKLLFTLE